MLAKISGTQGTGDAITRWTTQIRERFAARSALLRSQPAPGTVVRLDGTRRALVLTTAPDRLTVLAGTRPEHVTDMARFFSKTLPILGTDGDLIRFPRSDQFSDDSFVADATFTVARHASLMARKKKEFTFTILKDRTTWAGQ